MKRLEQWKVVVYGLGNTVRDAMDYIRTRFHVVACSDGNLAKAKMAKEWDIPFLMPEKLKEIDYDYILIVSVFDQEIYEYLTKELEISHDRVLKRSQWWRMRVHYEFGEQNPDKTFYVLSRPIHTRDGLFSFLFAFLEQLDFVEKNGYVPVVDMKNFPNQYLEEKMVGVENAWDYYFKPLSKHSLEEVYDSKNVVLGYDDACYKAGYEKKYDIRRMGELYQKFIHYNSQTLFEIDKEYKKILEGKKNVLGVLCRGTDMNALGLKNHSIQPTVDEMICLIYKYMEEWKCESIFLSTEDADVRNRLKQEFGKRLHCTNQQRFCETGKQWLANIKFDRQQDPYLRGLEYLVTIEMLSRCDCLLAGICAGSVFAQIMNRGKYQHVKMIDKGVFE